MSTKMKQITNKLYSILKNSIATSDEDIQKLKDKSTDHTSAKLRHILMYCLDAHGVKGDVIAKLFECKREGIYYAFKNVEKLAKDNQDLRVYINNVYRDTTEIALELQKTKKRTIIIIE